MASRWSARSFCSTTPASRDRRRACYPARSAVGASAGNPTDGPSSWATADQGAIIVTGHTSAQRGRTNFAGFAPTRGGTAHPRRSDGSKGVPVAYIVVIDAVIDVPRARQRFKDKARQLFLLHLRRLPM